MTILVLSADEDAAGALCSALTRSGCAPSWETQPDSARDVARRHPPSVVVADTSVPGHARLVDEVRVGTPWARVYLLGDALADRGLPVVQKPFDASGLADVLMRELELARLDRGHRTLQAQAEELGLLLEASFEAIVALAADGTIRSWNLGAANLYGYVAHEVIGRHISVLDVDPGRTAERLAGAPRSVMDIVRRRKDGSEVLTLVSLSRVERPGSAEHGYAEVSLDVGERRKLERELEHAERLAAIGRLAAGMAHEINNPLAVIHASVAYIAESAERFDDPELEECLRDTRLAVERIGSFVQHVVGFARRERPQLSDARLTDAVDIAFRMVRPRARDRGVTVHVEAFGDVRVPHDPTRLAQALLNVLSNAVDAAATGGREVRVRALAGPDAVRIQVDDSGAGIDPAIAARLFEPFATTKPYGQGTGLGLAITKQIVDDHGGRIEIGPAGAGGTRVEIRLPGLQTSDHRVLVVDEDPAVRRALAADLRREGFLVAQAGMLGAARDELLARHTSVIVVDVRLPDAGSLDVVPTLRATLPAARIVVLAPPTERVAVGDADLVVPKPWDRAELVAAVRRLCSAG